MSYIEKRECYRLKRKHQLCPSSDEDCFSAFSSAFLEGPERRPRTLHLPTWPHVTGAVRESPYNNVANWASCSAFMMASACGGGAGREWTTQALVLSMFCLSCFRVRWPSGKPVARDAGRPNSLQRTRFEGVSARHMFCVSELTQVFSSLVFLNWEIPCQYWNFLHGSY